MSLDYYLVCPCCDTAIFEGNLTHNLTAMAAQAALYAPMWRPETVPIATAGELVPYLEHALAYFSADPAVFAQLNPANGWGSFGGLKRAVVELLEAYKAHPDCRYKVSR